MSKTVKYKHQSRLFKNGQRGHHNTLQREFRVCEVDPICDYRYLIDRADYESSRLGGWRAIGNGKRRAALKRQARQIINDELNEN